MSDLRREDDRRFGDLRGDLRVVARDVADIKLMLSEPEGTPQGRSLQRQINALDVRLGPVEIWYRKMSGVWMAIGGVGVVLGIIGSFFGLAAFFGWGGPRP